MNEETVDSMTLLVSQLTNEDKQRLLTQLQNYTSATTTTTPPEILTNLLGFPQLLSNNTLPTISPPKISTNVLQLPQLLFNNPELMELSQLSGSPEVLTPEGFQLLNDPAYCERELARLQKEQSDIMKQMMLDKRNESVMVKSEPTTSNQPAIVDVPVKKELPEPDIITIDDDDDDNGVKNDAKESTHNRITTNLKLDEMKLKEEPKTETYPERITDEKKNLVTQNEAKAEVDLIPGSRKVTAGGSIIHIFKRSAKRKTESPPNPPLQNKDNNASPTPLKDDAADKETVVSSASSEEESAGLKRRRPNDASAPAAGGGGGGSSSTHQQLEGNRKKAYSSSSNSSSLDSGLPKIVPGSATPNAPEDPIGKKSTRGDSRSRSATPPNALLPPSPPLVDDSPAEVIFDECPICGDTIPRMSDSESKAMTHHMAQEHDDIPTGRPKASTTYSIECRHCHSFFQDEFIRDLHEKNVCDRFDVRVTDKDCKGCQLSSGQSDLMLMQHLAAVHKEIPPGATSRELRSDARCPICKLWFNNWILENCHLKTCIKAST